MNLVNNVAKIKPGAGTWIPSHEDQAGLLLDLAISWYTLADA